MCAQAITLSHSTDSLSEMMAGLAVLDNVIDLDHDLEEEEEEEEEGARCQGRWRRQVCQVTLMSCL